MPPFSRFEFAQAGRLCRMNAGKRSAQ